MIKSLKLAAYNWKVLLKCIVYQALLLALVIALGYVIFGNLVDDLGKIFNENNVKDFAYNTINAIVAGDFDSAEFAGKLSELIANMQQSISSIKLPWGGVTMSYTLFWVIFLAYRLLVSLTDVTAGCQLEEFMTSNAERPFTWYFVKKQGKSWKFVLLQTALVLPLDALIICGSVGFYLLFMVAFRWWTIIPVAIFALLFYVARLSIFSFCLPTVVCQEGVSTRIAFKQGLSKAVKRFWHVFWKTLIVVCLMVLVSVISIMFVNNALALTALTTIPNFVLFFYLKCINMVEYFQTDKRPFFYKRVEVEGTERYNRKHSKR